MKKNRRINFLVSILVTILIGLGLFVLIKGRVKAERESAKRKYLEDIQNEFEGFCNHIENRILSNVYLGKSLSSYVAYNPSINQAAYKDFVSKVHKYSQEELISIQLVKDSIILYNYPREGNEITQGKNIMKIEQDSDYVRKCYRNKLPMTIGPRILLQQKLGLVYRDPILIKVNEVENLWGYSVVVINLKELISNKSLAIPWEYSLYSEKQGIDSSGYFFGTKRNTDDATFYKQLNILNDSWKVYAFVDLAPFYATQFLKSEISIGLFSLILAFTFATAIGLILLLALQLLSKNKLLEKKRILIEEALQEKSTLIKEVHHRIKNHFKLMNSLNNILYTDSEDKNVQEVVSEINNRVQSISEVYNQLDEQGKQLKTKKYLKALIDNIQIGTTANVDFQLDVQPNEMDVKQMTYLGVILNEMITNSLKHAFKASMGGSIKIKLEENEKSYVLIYYDNGGIFTQDLFRNKSNSKGLDLLATFALQLRGELKFSSDGNWVGYRLDFPRS